MSSSSPTRQQQSPSRISSSPAKARTAVQRYGAGLVGEENPKLQTSHQLQTLIGNNAPMLVLRKKQLQSNKAKGKGKQAERWEWREFDNTARKDGLRLSHWEKALTSSEPYAFVKYNVSTNVFSYSTDEYLSYCRDDTGDWSKEETDYLFSLCHDYDLRWFVIKDRWEWPPEHLREAIAEQEAAAEDARPAPAPSTAAEDGQKTDQADTQTEAANADSTDATMSEAPAVADSDQKSTAKPEESATPLDAGTTAAEADPTVAPSTSMSAAANVPVPKQPKERSLEELKDRYFSICRRLIRNRPASDQNAKNSYLHSYIYEKDRETLRKQHIREHILTHTQEQIDEEEFLYIESRRLEQTYLRTSREREELWRLLGGIGPQSSSAAAQTSSFLSQQAQANAAAAAGINNKKRRRGELDMLEQISGNPEKTGAAPQLTTAQDEQFCITRYGDAGALARPSGVYLRSSKPPALKTSLAPKIQLSLLEHGINMRLAMPTKGNMEKLEGLVSAITSLLDCKKQVERAENEVKVLRTRREAAMRIQEEDNRVARMASEGASSTKESSAAPDAKSALTAMQID